MRRWPLWTEESGAIPGLPPTITTIERLSVNKYRFTAEVRRELLDTVSVAVLASSEDEAHEKATRVLETYPEPHDVEDVTYVYTENREHLERD